MTLHSQDICDLLEIEVWEQPERLSLEDWQDHSGADWRWSRTDRDDQEAQ